MTLTLDDAMTKHCKLSQNRRLDIKL